MTKKERDERKVEALENVAISAKDYIEKLKVNVALKDEYIESLEDLVARYKEAAEQKLVAKKEVHLWLVLLEFGGTEFEIYAEGWREVLVHNETCLEFYVEEEVRAIIKNWKIVRRIDEVFNCINDIEGQAEPGDEHVCTPSR